MEPVLVWARLFSFISHAIVHISLLFNKCTMWRLNDQLSDKALWSQSGALGDWSTLLGDVEAVDSFSLSGRSHPFTDWIKTQGQARIRPGEQQTFNLLVCVSVLFDISMSGTRASRYRGFLLPCLLEDFRGPVQGGGGSPRLFRHGILLLRIYDPVEMKETMMKQTQSCFAHREPSRWKPWLFVQNPVKIL